MNSIKISFTLFILFSDIFENKLAETASSGYSCSSGTQELVFNPSTNSPLPGVIVNATSQETNRWAANAYTGNCAACYWSPSDKSQAYIQVTFPAPVLLTSITTAGGADVGNCGATSYCWVNNYMVLISVRPHYWWQYVLDSTTGRKMVFSANYDAYTGITNKFTSPVVATGLIIVPLSVSADICLRFKVSGCYMTSSDIATLPPLDSVGLQSRRLLDSQFTASSTLATSTAYYPPWSARVFLTAPTASELNFWQPKATDTNPWLQVDLQVLHDINGIVMRGAPGTDCFVTSLTIAYATTPDDVDNITFISCSGTNCIGIQIFDACVNDYTAFFIPVNITARIVRIYPLTNSVGFCTQIDIIGQTSASACPVLGASSFQSMMATQLCACAAGSGCLLSPSDMQIFTTTFTSLQYITRLIIDVPIIPGFDLSTLLPTVTIRYANYSGIYRNLTSNYYQPPTFNIVASVLQIVYVTLLPLRAITMQFGVQFNTTQPVCMSVTYNGCSADACPSNYIEHQGSCYRVLPIYTAMYAAGLMSQYNQKQICKNQASWFDDGHLVTITSEEENSFVRHLTRRYNIPSTPNTCTILGFFYQSLTRPAFVVPNNTKPTVTFTWITGENNTLQLWDETQAPYQPDGSTAQACASMCNNFWNDVACSTPGLIVCETQSSVANIPKTGCSKEWVGVTNMVLNSTSVMSPNETSAMASEVVLTATECLWLCHSAANSSCLSVAYSFSTSLCLLYATNQYTVGSQLSFATGWDYYEWHCYQTELRSLVWASGGIPITGVSLTSSSYVDSATAPQMAVYGTHVPWLYSATEWMASVVDSNQYLLVDYGKVYLTYSMLLQGSYNNPTCRVTAFQFSYGLSTTEFIPFTKADNSLQTFLTAEDSYAVSKTMFDLALVSRYFLIQPLAWVLDICLRIETQGTDLVFVDVQASQLVYNQPSVPIVRSVARNYSFTLRITSPTNSSDIPGSRFGNWEIGYRLDTEPHDMDGLLQANDASGLLASGIMAASVTQLGLPATTVVDLAVTMTLNFSFEMCEQPLYLCALVSASGFATFSELDPSNNAVCLLLDLNKDCYPLLFVDVTSISFLPANPLFVRGYNTSNVNVSFILYNNNSLINVAALTDNTRQNFKIKIYLTYFSTPDGVLSVADRTILNGVIADSSFAQRDIEPLSGLQVNMLFPDNILVPRQQCYQRIWLCVQMTPGYWPTYTLPTGYTSIECSNISSYVNCPGIPISNVAYFANPNYLMAGQSVMFNASWLLGSEPIFNVNVSSSTPLAAIPTSCTWLWNVANFTTSYGSMSTFCSRTFPKCGTYSAKIAVFNGISSVVNTSNITVIPVLNESIFFDNTYVPAPAPNNVSLIITSYPGVWQCWSNVLCSFSFGDGSISNVTFAIQQAPMYFNHTYTLAQSEVYASVYCYDNFTYVTYQEMFILQQNITQLNVTTTSDVYPSDTLVSFKITMSTGSNVVYHVDYGDGTVDTYADSNVYAYQQPFLVNHTYPTPGNYTIRVFANNKYYSANATMPFQITIQNPVMNYTFMFDQVLTIPPSTSVLSIQPDVLMKPATDVTCDWGMATRSGSVYGTELQLNLLQSIVVLYNLTDVGLGLNFSVRCYNSISEQWFFEVVDIYIIITELNVTVSRNNDVKIQVSLQNNSQVSNRQFAVLLTDSVWVVAGVATGSAISYTVEFGSTTVPSIGLLTSADIFSANHVFSTVGNYTLNVTVWNRVSMIEFTSEVIVQNAVGNLTLNYSSVIVFPPGTAHFWIQSAASSSSPLTDVSCEWLFTNGDEMYTYIPVLDELHPYLLTYHFSFIDVGMVNISVNCSNLLSYQLIDEASVQVLADAVILKSLFCNVTMIRNTSHILLAVRKFATCSCFLIDYGDGQTAALANNVTCCQSLHALGGSNCYKFINTQNSLIDIPHTYASSRTYVIHVFAFSLINNDTLTTKAVILPLPCTSPKIFPASNFSSNSYTNYRSVAFVSMPNVTLNCSRVWPYSATWNVLDISSSSISLQQTGFVFNYSSNSLGYGLYNVSLTVTMLSAYGVNMDGLTTAVYFMLNIIKTPLHAYIAGGPLVNISFPNTYFLDALSTSYDPDQPATDKTGLTFRWFCSQPVDDVTCSVSTSAAITTSINHMYDLKTGTGGCFGDGPGQLSENNGQLFISTGNMLPFKNYSFCVQFFKDTRVASFQQTLQVTSGNPPIISVKCRENCADRLSLKGLLIVDGQCMSDCNDRFGGITLVWRLYLMVHNETSNSSTPVEVLGLQNMTLSGVSKPSIFLMPTTLQGGASYVLTLEGYTYSSQIGSDSYSFVANFPPYGGYCNLNPQTGTTFQTMFNISCFMWREFKQTVQTSKLTYNFYVQVSTSYPPFLMCYGPNICGPIVMPVGDPRANYTDIVIVRIIDRVGDYTEISFIVQVFPPSLGMLPRTQLMWNETFGNDTLLARHIAASSTQNMHLDLFCIVSVLNLPDSAVLPGVTQLDSASDIKKALPLKIQVLVSASVLCASYVPSDVGGLQQNNGLMRYILISGSVLPLHSLNTLSDHLTLLADQLNVFRASMTYEDRRSVRADLVYSSLDFFEVADFNLVGAGYSNGTESRNVACNPVVVNNTVSGKFSNSSSLSMNSSLTAHNATTNMTTTVNATHASNLTFSAIPANSSLASTVSLIHNISVNATHANNSLSHNSSSCPTVTQVLNSVMKAGMYTVDKIGNMSLSEMLTTDDPNETVNDRRGFLLTAKVVPSMLNGTNYTTSYASLSLIQVPQGSGICAQQKLFMSAVNPLIWDDSAENINTGLVDMHLDDCSVPSSSLMRRKRSLSSTNTSSAFNSTNMQSVAMQIELSDRRTPNPFIISSNLSIIDKFVYHQINMTNPHKDVIITVYPLQATQKLKLYVSMEPKPNNSNYLWYQEFSYLNWTRANMTNDFLFIAASSFTNVTNTLYASVTDSACDFTGGCPSMLSLSYAIDVTFVGSGIWDHTNQKWTSIPLAAVNSHKKAVFSCNLMGGFGAGFISPPNFINFSTVFDNFAQSLVDNAPVIGTIIGIIVIYIPLLLLCRRLDRKDTLKWAILPLVDNYPGDECEYEIHVYTGSMRHAGTDSQISVNIFGSDGLLSGVRTLQDGQRKNFSTSSICSFLMTTPEHLGVLKSMSVWHDNSGKGHNRDWNLSKIVIVDRTHNKWYLFACGEWLSMEREPYQVKLMLEVTNEMLLMLLPESSLLQNNIQRQIVEDHLWVSVGAPKDTASTFSRMERLSVCLSILFLTMIANAMWYRGSGDQSSGDNAIVIGPITVSSYDIYASIVSSLIVVPPILIITQLFVLCKQSNAPPPKPQAKTEHEEQSFDEKMSTTRSLQQLNSKPMPAKMSIPHWVVYIAWALVVIIVVVSAFFTILYAISWGGSRSTAWLVAFLLSFIESIILIQPIKVVVVVFLMTFLFKRDTDLRRFQALYGNMMFAELTPEAQKALEQLRQEAELGKKMRAMIKMVVFQSILVILLIIVGYSNQNVNVPVQNTQIQQTFFVNFTQVNQPNDFWKWCAEIVVPNLYYSRTYSGEETTFDDLAFLANTVSYRIGTPQVRQLRVMQKYCTSPAAMYGIFEPCTHAYSYVDEEQESFNKSWAILADAVTLNCTLDAYYSDVDGATCAAFVYQDESSLGTVPFWGTEATYSGGGYVFGLGSHPDYAIGILAAMKHRNWLDQFTRAVFVEFNVWNANTNLFNQIQIAFEFTPFGSVASYGRVDSIDLYRYSGSQGVLNMATEILCLVFMVILTASTIYAMVRQHVERKSLWNWLLMGSFILFYASLALYALRSYLTVGALNTAMNSASGIKSFQRVVTANNTFLDLFSLATFVAMLNIVSLLRYNKTIAKLQAALHYSFSYLLSFGLAFACMFMAFVSLINVYFGFLLLNYSSVANTATTLMQGMLGKFTFDEVVGAQGNVGALILLCYLFTMIFFVLNFLVAIINSSLYEVNKIDFTSYSLVVDYFWQTMINLFKTSNSLSARRKNKIHSESSNTTSKQSEDSLQLDLYDVCEASIEKLSQRLLHTTGQMYKAAAAERVLIEIYKIAKP